MIGSCPSRFVPPGLVRYFTFSSFTKFRAQIYKCAQHISSPATSIYLSSIYHGPTTSRCRPRCRTWSRRAWRKWCDWLRLIRERSTIWWVGRERHHLAFWWGEWRGKWWCRRWDKPVCPVLCSRTCRWECVKACAHHPPHHHCCQHVHHTSNSYNNTILPEDQWLPGPQ